VILEKFLSMRNLGTAATSWTRISIPLRAD
jgi:hypothetical protein